MTGFLAKLMGMSGDVSDEKVVSFLKTMLGSSFDDTTNKAIQEAPEFLEKIEVAKEGGKEIGLMDWVTLFSQKKTPSEPISTSSFINLLRVFGNLAEGSTQDTMSVINQILPTIKEFLTKNNLVEAVSIAIKNSNQEAPILQSLLQELSK